MMAEITMMLSRTVFLPKGSPGICNVREIKADIRRYDLVCEGGRVFCSGEADLLIEYLSFAKGDQYPGYEAYEQQMAGGGSMWQALLTLPFELTEEGDIPCPPLSEVTVGELKWFMISPHALEMTMELHVCWQEAAQSAPMPRPQQKENAWQQISLAEHEDANKKVMLGGARLAMEKDDKVMHMGVSDQGWQLAAVEETVMEETVMEETVAEEVTVEKAVAEEVVAEEVVVEEMVAEEVAVEEVLVEETVTEELELKKVIIKFAREEEPAQMPPVIAQALATEATITEAAIAEEPQVQAITEAAQVQPRRRAAGLPQFQVRQMRQTSIYSVNFRIEE